MVKGLRAQTRCRGSADTVLPDSTAVRVYLTTLRAWRR